MLTPSTMGRFDPLSILKRGQSRNGRRIGRRGPMGPRVSGYAGTVVAKLGQLGPYLLMVLVVPGGSLMALLLWLYRRQKRVPVLPSD